MSYPPQQPGPYGPQDPYGQQPYGQQPYGQQPQYGAPQWGQPGYPMGPPPKKSRTGLITTLVIVAVLVIGGGGVAAFLLLKDEGGGENPRAVADSFVKELGTQLSQPVDSVKLDGLKPLTCDKDFKELNEDLQNAREDESGGDVTKVTFAISDFKETSDGASFKMTPKPEGEDPEDPMDMKVVKEKDTFVVCGLYDQQDGGQTEAPGEPPASGDDSEDSDPPSNGSIPNPIPKTS